MTPKNYTKAQVLAAIERSNGVMSYVAHKLGCGWECARTYVQKWDETKEAFDQSECKVHTMAYQSFHRAIADGERWAVERILDTSARRDGHGMVSHAAIDHTSAGQRIEGIAVEFVTANAKPEPPPKPIAKAKPVVKPAAPPATPPPEPKPAKPPPPAPKPTAAKPASFREVKHRA